MSLKQGKKAIFSAKLLAVFLSLIIVVQPVSLAVVAHAEDADSAKQVTEGADLSSSSGGPAPTIYSSSSIGPSQSHAVEPRENKSRANIGGSNYPNQNHSVEEREEKNRTPENGNTPPVLTLLGDTHFLINLGEKFVDPGAVAWDKEDGNLTLQIVVTGSVNTSVVGTSSLIYKVTDSGGLLVWKKRTIYTLPEMYLPQMPECSGPFGRTTNILWNTGTTTEFYTRGFHYDNTPENYLGFVSPDLWPGDALDWHWVKPTSPGNYIEWDLGISTKILRTYPSQDHGPYPDEFYQYRVEVSNDRNVWENATQTALYVDDIKNVRTHDGVRDFASESDSLFRYVRIFSTQTVPLAHYEMDAIQACASPGFSVVAGNPGITSEDGGSVVLTITTNTRPDAPVSITLISSDTTEGTISTKELVFEAKMRTHSIIIQGVDDSEVDGDIEYTITSTGAQSKDLKYQGLSIPVVTITNLDNDVAGGSGGGGGGGGGSGGQRWFPPGWPAPAPTTPEVLGAETVGMCNYLNDYIRDGWNNRPIEVLKLQQFLGDYENLDVPLTGVYDESTISAVNTFQKRYESEILAPWGISDPTGYVYILTKKKINEIVCMRQLGLTLGQSQEIAGSLAVSRLAAMSSQSPARETIKDKSSVAEISATSTENLDTLALAGVKDKNLNTTSRLQSLAAAVFTIPDNRSELLQSLYYLLFTLLAIYILATIVMNLVDTSRITKMEYWSKKMVYMIIGLILALVGSVWFGVLSIVIPLLVILIVAAVFVLWSINRKEFSNSVSDPDSPTPTPSDESIPISSPNFIMVSSPQSQKKGFAALKDRS